jgi:hypothetical protein
MRLVSIILACSLVAIAAGGGGGGGAGGGNVCSQPGNECLPTCCAPDCKDCQALQARNLELAKLSPQAAYFPGLMVAGNGAG